VIAPLRAEDVARWSGGRLAAGRGEARFTSVSIDTRTLEAGALFFAIRGPQHDAHRFLDAAVRSGATGLVVEDVGALPAGLSDAVAVVAVDDTTRALAEVAAGHRAGFAGPVVAITGSNGKTTTKEMCAAILERRGPCLRTRGNLNNAYGVPFTLLGRRPEDRAAVVELGMNHRGEIAALAAIARPDVGVVTNAGTAHLEYLGSREEIAREKADLAAAIAPGGTAVLNADDALLHGEAGRVRAALVWFGRAPEAHVRAEAVHRDVPGRFDFELVVPEGRRAVHVAGLHAGTVPNALAAAAGARAAGAGLDEVAAGLAAYRPPAGRMQPRPLPGDVLVLDDTYNANPQSVDVALRGLAGLPGAKRTAAVLGDMGELGEGAPEAHRAAGALAAALGIGTVVAFGDHAPAVVEGARAGGLDPAHAWVARCHEEVVERLGAGLAPGDRILVKGSRSMRMERVVEGLAARREDG